MLQKPLICNLFFKASPLYRVHLPHPGQVRSVWFVKTLLYQTSSKSCVCVGNRKGDLPQSYGWESRLKTLSYTCYERHNVRLLRVRIDILLVDSSSTGLQEDHDCSVCSLLSCESFSSRPNSGRKKCLWTGRHVGREPGSTWTRRNQIPVSNLSQCDPDIWCRQ